MGFEEEFRKVKYHSYHIITEDMHWRSYPYEITGDVNFAILTKVAFAKFLLCKVTFFLFLSSIFGSKSLNIATLKVGV